jgi:hypothetical protein
VENQPPNAHLVAMDWAQVIVAAGTWALVAGTFWLVKGQLSVAKEQRQIQLYLELRKEFDGPLISQRKLLAQALLVSRPYEEINERVLDFFEDMGMLVRRNYVDREMIWDTFSYYATRWWSACKDYIAHERAEKGDNTLFADFEKLVERIYNDEMTKRQKTRTELEPSALEIKRFLENETRV